MLNITTIKTKEAFYNELVKRFPHNNIEILEYEKASGPIKYKCKDCGRIYEKSRANHLYENITLCSRCYTGRESVLRNKFLENLEKNNFELLSKNTTSTAEKMLIRCKKCGKTYSRKIQQNDETFTCFYCGKNGAPVSKEIFIKRMAESGKPAEEYSILKYNNFTHSATFKHKCGQIFSMLPSNFLNSRGCPKCYKRSVGEQRVAAFLKEKNINFEEQKKFKELGKYSYDFYLPDHNMLIEYQGAQHYYPIPIYGGEKQFLVQQEHDRIKREFAKNNKIMLIEIPYTDLKHIDKHFSFLEGSTTIPIGSRSECFEAESPNKV